jgi:LruC domain-containing protein
MRIKKNKAINSIYQKLFLILSLLVLSIATFGAKVSSPTFSPNGGTFTTPVSVAIATTTVGATIRYTTDNSTPSATNGIVYTGAIVLSNSCTLRAIAYKTGMTASNVLAKNFLITKVVAPTMSPAAGSYSSPQSVTLSSLTTGVSIRYTTDGSTPSSTIGTLYSAPVIIGANLTLKAIAYKTGLTNSDVSWSVYTISCAQPTFNPVAGTYNGSQTVSILSTTIGVSIRYTTDGTTPSSTVGTVYSSPVVISENTTIKAIAYKIDMNPSPISSAAYSIKCASPVFSPVAGTYSTSQNVSITSATVGSTIRYTNDGSVPSQSNGNVYSSSINISAATNLQAIAYKTGNLDSDITSGSYTILSPTEPPIFSPLPGTYSMPQSVSISSATIGATIRYTTDGTTPSQSIGTVYSSAVPISATSTLKAIAYKTGNSDSNITSGLYTILFVTESPIFSPAAGTYDSPQNVAITSATTDATIRYTTDGSTPSSTSGSIYSSPIQMNTSGTLKAIAYKSGILDSPVNAGNYLIQNPDTDGDGVQDSDDDYPTSASKAFNNNYPASGFASLAFEDLWPSTGDYDFNDLVLNYNFQLVTNAQNNVVEINAEFLVVAVGASIKNGFGFQIDALTPNQLSSVSGQSISGTYINRNANGTEANQLKAVIIVMDDVNTVLHRAGGSMFNTVDNGYAGTADAVKINIVLAVPLPINTLGTAPFNPFLIKALDRSLEIHLSNQVPTDLANTAIFGTFNDASSPSSGQYYKTIKNLPWAINIPEPFNYTFEGVQILEGHLRFGEWAESAGVSYPDWYQNNTGNRDLSKIYK